MVSLVSVDFCWRCGTEFCKSVGRLRRPFFPKHIVLSSVGTCFRVPKPRQVSAYRLISLCLKCILNKAPSKLMLLAGRSAGWRTGPSFVIRSFSVGLVLHSGLTSSKQRRTRRTRHRQRDRHRTGLIPIAQQKILTVFRH